MTKKADIWRRKKPLKRKRRIRRVNSDRKKREFERTYHSQARVKWIKSLPCSVPGCQNGPCENAHVSPEGDPSGVARKHDFTQTIPLCRQHHSDLDDRLGQRLFNDRHRIDVDLVAAATEERWRRKHDDEDVG